MDLLRGRISAIYFRYLGAAFGSAMISSIYGIVDMAIVGQYQGPDGTAALAVVAPVWNIIYSLGLLAGIGGGVLFSVARGRGGAGESGANDYFSAAFIGTVIFSSLSWAAIVFFDRRMLLLFGADETLLPLARQYLWPVKFAVPVFIFNQMLAAFLRNDGSPGLATAAVLFGGLFNVAGDYFFVFTLDMGIMGAGLATAIGGGTHPRGDAGPLFLEEEYAAAGEAAKPAHKAEEDHRHRLFNLLHRYRDGDTDGVFQPPDHALLRHGGAGRLRRDRQHQHGRPVLRLQHRTGVAADNLDKFRRGKVGAHQGHAAVRPARRRPFSASPGPPRRWPFPTDLSVSSWPRRRWCSR